MAKPPQRTTFTLTRNNLTARYAIHLPSLTYPSHPFPQIWFGDHPNGPARTVSTNELLSSLIAANPAAYLTPSVSNRFPNDPQHLPFLFKVLSFNKALPLQAHPDKDLAARLKAQEQKETGKNETFVDENYKPEVAVALADGFEAFVGFRPVREIQAFVRCVPEVREVLGAGAGKNNYVDDFLDVSDEKGEDSKRLLKAIFGQLLLAKPEAVSAASKKLLARVAREGNKAFGAMGDNQAMGNLVKKMMGDYPEDVGMFAATVFMNYVVLNKGEGIAVPENCIHVYLTGDIVECMAWSDNMVCTFLVSFAVCSCYVLHGCRRRTDRMWLPIPLRAQRPLHLYRHAHLPSRSFYLPPAHALPLGEIHQRPYDALPHSDERIRPAMHYAG